MNEEFLEWLDERDGYYVKQKDVEEQFPELNVKMIGITRKIDDEGDTLIPKRDYKQAVKYGQVYD